MTSGSEMFCQRTWLGSYIYLDAVDTAVVGSADSENIELVSKRVKGVE